LWYTLESKKGGSSMTYLVKEYGAAGDGVTNDTKAVQQAIEACAAAGGGKVVIESGYTHFIGTIHLRSKVELVVERGGKILLSDKREDFEETRYSGPQRFGIMAENAEDTGISGAGEINGNGEAYITEKLPHIYRVRRGRPFMIGFFNCRNVSMKDIKIKDAPCWTVVFSECENVEVNGISILNDLLMPNNDGIDIDHSRFVRIINSHFECGDDCIVLKTHTSFDGTSPCENIAVTNCTMTSLSFAINLGCEVHAPIRNCVFDNCVIVNSHHGIGVHLSAESNIENVIFSNMYIETRYYNPDWWGAAEPIYVVSIPWTKDDTVGYIKNIKFSNIICRSENGVIVYGDDMALIDRVTFDNVSVFIDKFSEEEGGRYDLRPCDGDNNGRENGIFAHDTSGFYIRNAKNVEIRNSDVTWGENRPAYFKHALLADGAENLKLINFYGDNAEGNSKDGVCIK